MERGSQNSKASNKPIKPTLKISAAYGQRCASFGSAKRGVGAWQRIAQSAGKPPVTLSDHVGVT